MTQMTHRPGDPMCGGTRCRERARRECDLQRSVGVAGGQHAGDEADGVEERRPRHVVLLDV